jgi:tetratricopeptide (TPR) repeat protein
VDKARNELGRARASLLEGDTDGAREVSQRVLAQHADSAPVVAAEAHALVGEAHFADGDLDAARRSYQAAVLAMTGIGSDREAAQRWYALAELLAQVGDEAGALQAYRSAGAAVGLRGYAAAGARQRDQQSLDRLAVEA